MKYLKLDTCPTWHIKLENIDIFLDKISSQQFIIGMTKSSEIDRKYFIEIVYYNFLNIWYEINDLNFPKEYHFRQICVNCQVN